MYLLQAKCLRPLTHTVNLKKPEELGETLPYATNSLGQKSFLLNSLLVHTLKKLTAFYVI